MTILNPVAASLGAMVEREVGAHGCHTHHKHHHHNHLHHHHHLKHLHHHHHHHYHHHHLNLPNQVAKIWWPILDLHLTTIKERLFVTKSVGEILFDGFHDPLFDELDSLPSFFKKFVPPGLTDKFAFFYQVGISFTTSLWICFFASFI